MEHLLAFSFLVEVSFLRVTGHRISIITIYDVLHSHSEKNAALCISSASFHKNWIASFFLIRWPPFRRKDETAGTQKHQMSPVHTLKSTPHCATLKYFSNWWIFTFYFTFGSPIMWSKSNLNYPEYKDSNYPKQNMLTLFFFLSATVPAFLTAGKVSIFLHSSSEQLLCSWNSTWGRADKLFARLLYPPLKILLLVYPSSAGILSTRSMGCTISRLIRDLSKVCFFQAFGFDSLAAGEKVPLSLFLFRSFFRENL